MSNLSLHQTFQKIQMLYWYELHLKYVAHPSGQCKHLHQLLWNAKCRYNVYRLNCWIKCDASTLWRWIRSFSWPNVCHSWPDLLGACMCRLCELCVARCPPPDLWDYSNLCWLIWLIRFISTRPQSSRMRCGGGVCEVGRAGEWGFNEAVGAIIFFSLFVFCCFGLLNISLRLKIWKLRGCELERQCQVNMIGREFVKCINT